MCGNIINNRIVDRTRFENAYIFMHLYYLCTLYKHAFVEIRETENI